MKSNNFKKIRKKLKLKKHDSKSRLRRSMGLKKKQIQIPNIILADRILKGTVNLESLRNVQNRKYFYQLQGKSSSDISLEKYVLKQLRNQKKERMKKARPDTKQYFKFKKEPEKNKTHWDYLLDEMKWMANDFERERKMKKKFAVDMAKGTKKHLDTRHLEVGKNIKRQEQDLKRRTLLMARSVNHYWKKIEKLTKYNYNIILQENKLIQQQTRLLNFITKLQKISSRVAKSLPSGKTKDMLNNNTNELSYLNNTIASKAGIQINDLSTKMNVDDAETVISNSNTIASNNPSLSNVNNINVNEEFIIVLKKNEDDTHSIIDNNFEENLFENAAKCAESFLPTGTDLAQCKIDTQVPFLLKNNLREYQLIGLHWLTALHDNKINGILADEMGLGKTIQTIALIAHLACNKGIWGPHLIVVPTTIIINWEIEFKKWCPSLKILSYYGNQKERKAKRHGWHKANSFNVCITSYKLVIQDYSIFKRKRWYYIILDEAQNIKNFKSKRWQLLLNFKSKRKLLLTGTPLQNDIMEIWSYMHFLMPNLFYSNEEFRNWFYSQFYEAVHNNASLNKKLVQSLHSILRPFLLRRLKKDVEKQLPEKIEHVVYCELTRRQRYLYDEYISSERTQDTLKQNDYFSIMNVLMQLRKVCNHPDLFDSRDYVTPSRQLYNIYYFIPYLILNLLAYDPLKSINLKHLNFIFEEFEKITKFDYFSMIKNFPIKPFYQIIKEIIEKERVLYNPNYNLDEGDILYRRQYYDSTILYESNTKELKSIILSQNQNIANQNGNLSLNPNLLSNNSTDLNSQTMIQGNNSFGHNIPYPKYICPTNIPLLKNSSLSSYFDIMYEIYTLDVKIPQDYYKSVFQDNILKIRKIKEENKLKAFHEYDLQSRRNLIYQKPILGNDLTRLIKMNLIPANLSSKQYIYGKSATHELFYNNINNSVIFNKFFKKTNFDECDKKDKLNNKIYEGIYKDRVLQNELDRLISLLEQKEKELEEEKEREMKILNMSNMSHQSHIKKSAINPNPDYKNNLILNQNKKINSSININNLNLNLNKNKHLKLANLAGNHPSNEEKDEIINIDNDSKDIEKNGIIVKKYTESITKEDNKNLENESLFRGESTINDIEMTNQEIAGDESIKNQVNEELEFNQSYEEIIEIENEENNIPDNNNNDPNEDIKEENTINQKADENKLMDIEKYNHDCPKSESIVRAESENEIPNGNINQMNQQAKNNSENFDTNKIINNDEISKLNQKNPSHNHTKNKITTNSKSETIINNPKVMQNNPSGKISHFANVTENTYNPNPEKLKEIENLKTKINLLKKLLKPKFVNKIKENYVEMKVKQNSCTESIEYVYTDSINEMIFNPQKMITLCEELMTRYKFFIPKFLSNGPQLISSKISCENQQTNNRYRMLYNNLNRVPNVQKYLSLFKIISLPDKKLVEYDSGKLMKLAKLLKTLKQNKSKALIFTQMTRMLDILEIFLNLHGYTYVRLDGSTKVEVRQQIVDRFNNDNKIFCFISSTRSGGIGLNLTGADSIVFFDTDWNPAMDKQAQDRCHRIGQTRTVHIYRLITLSTIEENIFKKSIQKRELNYVIMEDGKFDIKNFNKLNLKSIVEEEKLINVNEGRNGEDNDQIKKLLEFENLKFDNEEDQKNLEQLLIKIEDQEDVQAMKNLSKEMLDEYEQENIEKQFFDSEEIRDQMEIDKEQKDDFLNDPKILSSLKGVDKFAMKFYKSQYSYDDFVREKEIKTNTVIFQSDNSEEDIEDDLEIGKGEEEDQVNKLDLDHAYEMYLNKRSEIMKNLEEKRKAEEEENLEMQD